MLLGAAADLISIAALFFHNIFTFLTVIILAKLFMEKLIHVSKNFTQHTFLSKVVIANIPKSNTFTSMETWRVDLGILIHDAS